MTAEVDNQNPTQVSRTYFGNCIRQRENSETLRMFVFCVRVKDLKQWAGVQRIEDSPKGTQRVMRQSRQTGVRRFLEAFPTNTIPNSVLVAFDPGRVTYQRWEQEADLTNGCGVKSEWGYISFSFDEHQSDPYKPALIVDGQHRVYGMATLEGEDLPIVVVGLLDAPPIEQAFQFVTINDKAVRIDKADAKSILANFHEESLRDRLLKSHISFNDESPVLKEINDLPTSPFYKLLDWGYNRDGQHLVSLTAIERGLKFIRSYYSVLETDDDSLVEIFCAIWRAAKTQYPTLWCSGSKFLTKVNILALTEYLSQRLKIAWEYGLVDLFTADEVQQRTDELLAPIPTAFWESKWSVLIQDNSNVRQLIKDDLDTMAGNFKAKRKWFTDLRLPEDVNTSVE